MGVVAESLVQALLTKVTYDMSIPVPTELVGGNSLLTRLEECRVISGDMAIIGFRSPRFRLLLLVEGLAGIKQRIGNYWRTQWRNVENNIPARGATGCARDKEKEAGAGVTSRERIEQNRHEAITRAALLGYVRNRRATSFSLTRASWV